MAPMPATETKAPRWSMARTVGVGVLALGLAVGAAAVVSASADGESAGVPPRTFGGYGQQAGADGIPGGTTGTGGTGTDGLGAGSLHGEFVVPNGAGGFQTIRTQTGEIVRIDGSSLTIESADGFTATYLASALSPGIEVGSTVTVVATVSGSTATITSITDSAGDPGVGGSGQPGGAPSGQIVAPQGAAAGQGGSPPQRTAPSGMPAPMPDAVPESRQNGSTT